VRRAKLYYLRGLTGKKARIVEKIARKTGADLVVPQPVKEDIMPAEQESAETSTEA
jgi:hypothetical protein